MLHPCVVNTMADGVVAAQKQYKETNVRVMESKEETYCYMCIFYGSLITTNF